MKHLKHHPINDELSNLSDDMKEQDHVKKSEPSNKKLDADKSLSDPSVNMKVQKPSNKKLDGENFLSEEVASTVKIHLVDNKAQHLAKTKKENHIKFKKKDKKLKPEKSLQEVEVPTKKIKTSHEPLGAEKSLSTDGGKIKNFQNYNK
jgi:hypothetical protein